MFFCHAAADIFDELPQYTQPAPMSKEEKFRRETMMFKKPFAVHQFWPPLRQYTA